MGCCMWPNCAAEICNPWTTGASILFVLVQVQHRVHAHWWAAVVFRRRLRHMSHRIVKPRRHAPICARNQCCRRLLLREWVMFEGTVERLQKMFIDRCSPRSRLSLEKEIDFQNFWANQRRQTRKKHQKAKIFKNFQVVPLQLTFRHIHRNFEREQRSAHTKNSFQTSIRMATAWCLRAAGCP